MQIKIYQINTERDNDRAKFQGLFEAEKTKINPEIYDRVFTGDVECKDLEEVFTLFNLDGHRLHRGHTLSVSDIVEVDKGDTPHYYFCDVAGFKEIPFDSTRTHAAENLIRVLVVEPHRPPYESEIENTVKGQQRAVEGYIEYLSNDDGTIIVVNEEGKYNGMEANRHIDGDVLVGPFFIAGDGDEKLCSLNDDQLKKYAERFAEPETIYNDTEFNIIHP